jgi:hypothetical protein
MGADSDERRLLAPSVVDEASKSGTQILIASAGSGKGRTLHRLTLEPPRENKKTNAIQLWRGDVTEAGEQRYN